MPCASAAGLPRCVAVRAVTPTESLLAVDNQEGVTRIAPLDEAGRSVLRDRLFTPGELLRQNQLAPDPATLAAIESDRQLKLFELAQP